MQAGCQKITVTLRAALENGMSAWPTHSEEGRSIPGAEPIRRIFVLLSFELKFILNYTGHNVWNAGFDGPWECECFRRKIRFVQFSIIRKHIMRHSVVTNYIRKRLSKQNEKTGLRTEPLGTPQVRSEGEDFTSFTVTTCVLPCR